MADEPMTASGTAGLRTTVFVATAALLLLVGLLLGRLLPPDPAHAPPEIEALFIDCQCDRKDGLRPEAKERTTFLALAVSAPLLALGVHHLFRRRAPTRRASQLAYGIAALLAVVASAIVASAGLPLLASVLDDQRAEVLSALLLLAVVTWYAARRMAATTLAALGLAAASAVGLYVAFALKYHDLSRLTDWSPDEIHLAAVLFAIAQSVGGKHCLVDYVPQYGCYGELLAPAVRALGSTLDSVSWLMIALTALGLAAIGLFVARTTRRAGLAAWAVAGLVLLWTLSSTRIPPDIHDHYYQYYPVRFVMPALSLALGLAWRGPSPLRAAGYGVFAALALLWNPDSGITVIGSLLAVIGFDLVPRAGGLTRPTKLAALAVLSFAAAFALGLWAFVELMALQSGVRPDLRGLVHHADIFFVSGWFMLPIPLVPSCWQVVVGIYLALLVWGVTGDARDLRARRALQLGVLGVGAFLYYVGRSHPGVLNVASWPALPGLLLLVDAVPVAALPERLQRLSPTLRALTASALSVTLGLGGVLAWAIVTRPPPHALLAMPEIGEQIAFIERTSSPRTPLAVFAMQQGPLLLHARRGHALEGPGIVEMALVEDLTHLNQQLDAGRVELVYVDRELAALRPFWFDPIRPHLQRNFDSVATSKDGRLELFRYKRR